MDQEQTGPAAVPCTRSYEGSRGVAVGLPHLPPAALDSTRQAKNEPCTRLKETIEGRKNLGPRNRQRKKHGPHLSPLTQAGFFTASTLQGWATAAYLGRSLRRAVAGAL